MMPKAGSRWWWLALIVIVLAVWRAPASQATTQNADVLSALLIEVRGLRAAMEQLGSAGPRVQLLIGRLTLQEQRLTPMLQRLDDLRSKIGMAEREVSQKREDIIPLQEALTRGNQEEREAADRGIRAFKYEIGVASAELQRLRTEESELSANIASEQARWVEINQRLDELERALGKK
jgi:hypothetical protein